MIPLMITKKAHPNRTLRCGFLIKKKSMSYLISSLNDSNDQDVEEEIWTIHVSPYPESVMSFSPGETNIAPENGKNRKK